MINYDSKLSDDCVDRPQQTPFHTHVDERGRLIKCYHETKAVFLSLSFWAGVTLSFPLEHWLWEKVWPFKVIAIWMGL